jgi:hypothetical protein
VDTSYHQSIRQVHKIKPVFIEQEHPRFTVVVNVMRNLYLLTQHKYFVENGGSLACELLKYMAI